MTESNSPVAVVVGGTGQIGQHIVKGFLAHGCRVTSVSRGMTDLSSIRTLATSEILNVIYANVSDEAQVRECFQTIKKAQGRLDFVVYGPGIHPDIDVPLARYALESWDATFHVYVRGLFLCFREAFQHFRSGGHFCVLSSAITRFPEDKLPPFHVGHYAAAKAAVNELCKWGRRDLHEKNCFLSRVAPAAVDVPYHRNAPPYRKPSVMIPVDLVVSKLVNAALTGKEIDEEITRP